MSELRRPILRITQPEAKPFRFWLDGDEVIIGRSGACDVAVKDTALSAKHLRVRRINATVVTVEDLDSTNGSYIDGQRLLPGQKHVLEANGRGVVFGALTLEVEP